ncbi:MAG: apolipoprotein N-acyltransferase [Alphaproteobacteria bacterium]|nr:MAG: apolipoprotein N-acyltransferase [Alphaproteobacteria bacterium]
MAAVCGGLATAAFAPLHAIPLLIPAFVGLLWLLDGARGWRAGFALGFSFGFGHMASGVYWIGAAFLVDAERFAAIMPVAIVGLAVLLALFPAAALAAVAAVGWRGPARVALLAAAWLGVEWLRSWVLTGFPWNLAGNVWSFSPAMIQLAALTGVWGLSVVTILAAAAPAVLGEAAATPGARWRRWWFVLAMTVALPAVVWGGGLLRLAGAPAIGGDTVPGVRLRLVQASIPQALKWQPDRRVANVRRQAELTVGPGYEAITHVIWPETAVPFVLNRQADVRQALARIVPPGGLLITGAPRVSGEGGRERIWNSLFALDSRGAIVGRYDKFHLVPGGEYVPLRGVLGLEKLAPGRMDFTPGPGPKALNLPGLPPVGPLICYEAIFPGQVTAPGARPAWLLNITNDAWFGTSAGPYQHFASARLRAVEEGLPLVRAANTGISAVIDGYGRIVARLALGQVGVVDAPLPRPVAGKPLYANIGNGTVPAMLLIVGIYTLILRRFVP